MTNNQHDGEIIGSHNHANGQSWTKLQPAWLLQESLGGGWVGSIQEGGYLGSIWQFVSQAKVGIDIAAVWVLTTTRENDSLPMDLATTYNFTPLQLHHINSCQVFLQVLTISNVTDKFCGLWGLFIRRCVILTILTKQFSWHPSIVLRCSPTFFKHKSTPYLYQLSEGELSMYHLARRQSSPTLTKYINVPCICDLKFNETDFFPVDVHVTPSWIQYLSRFPTAISGSKHDEKTITLQEAFQRLPSLLKWICGSVTFPCDNGTQLLSNINQSTKSFFGYSVPCLDHINRTFQRHM